MADIVSVRDEIPEEFASLVEAGEFWDTHDSGEYEVLMTPVEVEVTKWRVSGASIMQVLEKAEEVHNRQQKLEALNAAYAAVRANSIA